MKFSKIKNSPIAINFVLSSNKKAKALNYLKKKKINCLVNNAGERQRKDFTKIKKSDIHHIFENNFFSHFFRNLFLSLSS